MIIVIKRDGTEVSFNKEKIENAINKAFLEVDGQLYETDTARDIAIEIEQILVECGQDEVYIEDIQDMVEEKLLISERQDVAQAYINYRDKRSRIRNRNSEIMKEYYKKLRGENIENQNANVDEHSFGGRRGEASGVIEKSCALNDYISTMAKENHEGNMIYIHDLDSYAVGMHNCLSVPFDKLLANGFDTRQTDVRTAGSVSTAMQLVAVIFQLQSLQQFGGVSATHLDWTMVPYVRKSFYKHYLKGMKYLPVQNKDVAIDPSLSIEHGNYMINKEIYNYAVEMTAEEVHQAVEGLYHNLNTLQSRSGNQLPFTSINYGTCALPEGRLIIEKLLKVSIEGLGSKKRTSIFPCGIFQLGNGINKKPGDPNYDLFRLALRSTAQRLYPNYANIDWSGNAGYDPNDPATFFSTMGKRKL